MLKWGPERKKKYAENVHEKRVARGGGEALVFVSVNTSAGEI